MMRKAAIAALVACLATSAGATLTISTTARGLTSSVRVIGQPLTFVGPVAPVSGTTAPGFSLSNGAASFGTTVGLGTVAGVTAALGLNTGSIATAVFANGTTPANTTDSNGSATINDLNIALTTTTLGITTPVLGITADQLQSLTTGTRPLNITTLSGQSIFSNLAISVGGSQIFSLGSNQQVAANFVAYNANGLKITLNQQFASSYDNTRVLITNAIGVSFTNYLLDGRSLSGDITIGQTLTQFDGAGSDPIPEPSSWALLLAGFTLVGSVARRRPARITP